MARCVIRVRGLKSVLSAISRVRSNDPRRSAQNLRGLRSMHTLDCKSFKNPAGDS